MTTTTKPNKGICKFCNPIAEFPGLIPTRDTNKPIRIPCNISGTGFNRETKGICKFCNPIAEFPGLIPTRDTNKPIRIPFVANQHGPASRNSGNCHTTLMQQSLPHNSFNNQPQHLVIVRTPHLLLSNINNDFQQLRSLPAASFPITSASTHLPYTYSRPIAKLTAILSTPFTATP